MVRSDSEPRANFKLQNPNFREAANSKPPSLASSQHDWPAGQGAFKNAEAHDSVVPVAAWCRTRPRHDGVVRSCMFLDAPSPAGPPGDLVLDASLKFGV